MDQIGPQDWLHTNPIVNQERGYYSNLRSPSAHTGEKVKTTLKISIVLKNVKCSYFFKVDPLSVPRKCHGGTCLITFRFRARLLHLAKDWACRLRTRGSDAFGETWWGVGDVSA
jgi:hypothetical protein